ncbi:MAG TPA: hypothetical protein VLA56_12105 [Pseudomonadales bacterium]|nr:hypothetical protein [Pseudomonadales bacterium]
MNAFRALLVAIILCVGAYTAVTIADHGLNLLPVFFGDMAEMAWPGQFNLDFMCFLLLSGLWLAWRHEFSPAGIALGVGGVLLGAPYLALYLLITSFRVQGDVRALLLGEARAAA